MTKTELIKRAKQVLSEAYEEAAHMVAEFVEAHPRTALQSLCKEIDPDNWNGFRRRVQRAQKARESTSEAEIARAQAETRRKVRSGAKSVLRSPEERDQVLTELPDPELQELAKVATDTLVERARAKRREYDTTPTAGDLMGEDKFDPAEYWADTLVIRVNRNARELASLIQRAGGLLYGSMTPEEAFEYLHEAEGLIAEARAAAQEQSHDRIEVS